MDVNIKGVIVSNDDARVYDYFGVENISPKVVNKSISNANGEKLDVYINSGGGDIFAGSEIYTALRDYKGEVMIHIVGFAASAASVIACARKSEMSPTAMMMVHNVSGAMQGDYHDASKLSDVLQKANKTIAAAYVAKTGMTEKDALSMMDKETWLTATDAVEKGLVDVISQPQQMQLVASYNNGLLPQSVINKLKAEMPHLMKNHDADFLCKKAQSKLNLMKLGGHIYD